MLKDEIVQLEPDVFMGIDRSGRGHGDDAVYCQMRRMPDGTLLVEAFGRLIEGEVNKISTTEGYIKQRSTEVVQPMRSNDGTERDHQRQPG